MSATAYDWVLFDLDETLFDFPAHAALLALLEQIGLTPSEPLLQEYKETNHRLWEQFNAGAIDSYTLQSRRFIGIGEQVARCPLELNKLFLEQIVALSRPLDGVLETLTRLRRHVGMGIITNGFSAPQRGRLARHALESWFSPLVISDEVGVAKPRAAIFEHALKALPVRDPARVLMVGDNPQTDIGGAAAAGLATCWFDPHFSEAECHPTHRIHHFSQLETIVLG
ncbi:pyrimidine 5'-nucleotidase [Aeromonas simiae]|uniref:pyrimidine 5'-nucleotidase n=1 Tax=Aeromonas simiae TaxID=218936 RepID=UPI0005AAD112|nr:pyrimidine 5'-nucleotidase [Aeromonas simiae]MDO2947690.1 pyrimidine 5'-nucleotidase [Aeromonas simiae]MDO2952310.1 pyrimidine 5'-nucleotidase [Aeromonas simiae]MDO2954905.1 pyrimidine 5'-nucleotidase [Aeromonas simiae]